LYDKLMIRESGGMRENLLKKAWGEGRSTVNGWLGIPNAFAAETMAHCGWDSLTVDMQHGLVDYQAMVGMLQAISTTSVVPMVRVPWNEPGIIQKSLDAGAYGVICPMINSRAECEQLVSVCRYAPVGSRSVGPIRASIYGGSDYLTHANDTVLALAMIETKGAVENIDEILSVPGLDGVYVGPADLALTMGVTPGFDPTDETVLKAIRTIVDACKRHNVRAGLHTGSPEFAKKMFSWGFDFATVLGDGRLMAMKAMEVVAAMKDAPAKGSAASGTY
jgi:4-hydroxy-2-oxoheptanedioate aldolase